MRFSVAVLFTVSAILISSRLRRDAYWKGWQPILTTFAWLSALLLVVLVGVVISKAPLGGLAEKVFIVDRNIWGLLVGSLVFRADDRKAGASDAQGSTDRNHRRHPSLES